MLFCTHCDYVNQALLSFLEMHSESDKETDRYEFNVQIGTSMFLLTIFANFLGITREQGKKFERGVPVFLPLASVVIDVYFQHCC